MPRIETSNRYNTVVLCEKSGTDEYNNSTRLAPVEIQVRWEENQGEMLLPDGSTIAVDAYAAVNQNIPNGSILWLGTLADWVGTGSGSSDPQVDLMEVVGQRKVPDVKGRVYRRTLGLKRYKSSIPELA